MRGTTAYHTQRVERGAHEYLVQRITTNKEAAAGTMSDPVGELDLYPSKGINPMRTQLMVMHTAFEGDGCLRVMMLEK